jgi:hypothetical protein
MSHITAVESLAGSHTASLMAQTTLEVDPEMLQ